MSTLGESPAVLAKRKHVKNNIWCPKTNVEDDPWCDPDNPKMISYKDTVKATSVIKEHIAKTPLNRSKCCVQFNMELYYKFETVHRTGSFLERAALYSLSMLDDEQRAAGVITASLGNWGLALAYHGQRLNVPVTVVIPYTDKCKVILRYQNYGANIIQHGKDLSEAIRKAFIIKSERQNLTYINGYDHPHVIAASGSIALEILEQLPQTDVVLVPVGGGGLIAGIATVAKKLKPEIKIYGIEPKKCCSFFKAMENDNPFQTVVGATVAELLAVPKAGFNAFYTARSLIDKMVLVEDNWISRAILHLTEEEKMVTEGAGATALSAFFATPIILPELKGKTVVCVVSGGNTDYFTLCRNIERAKAIEGRLIKMRFTLSGNQLTEQRVKILRIIAKTSCNILQCRCEEALLEESFRKIYLTLICETASHEHACVVKRIMDSMFLDYKFSEDPYNPIQSCVCFPNPMLY
ncbi:L-threonine ammonia-lyase isoform X1 [Bombyx mori]|uniref:L-serine deaminase n=1 Tax=Bombyx mori TaxID=7091 RepID=A0A8R1WLI2_BOMMO|nr:L-threonine ammonia-lyase isoform X1 [Bombyx mori]